DRRRGGSEQPGALVVDTHRRRLLGLGPVDVGVGGAVRDRVGAVAPQRLADGGRIGDGEPGVAEGDYLVPARAAGGDEVSAEHPAGPGDHDPHHGIVISELSPTTIRIVFGRPSPRSSFTFRPSRLASILVPRSQTRAPARRIECSTSDPAIITPGPTEVYGPT